MIDRVIEQQSPCSCRVFYLPDDTDLLEEGLDRVWQFLLTQIDEISCKFNGPIERVRIQSYTEQRL